MDVTLLTPLGALIALGVIVPLVALGLLHRRGAAVRRSLGLPEPRPRVVRAAIAAVVVAAALLGLAAAQPRVEWTSDQRVRDDAEAIIVLDTSRSMLARTSPRSQIRFARATAAALQFRDAFENVPTGIASFTDRVLPHLFPSPDADVFAATLSRSLGIDRPPPHGAFVSTATRLEALETIVSRRFFTPTVRNRLIFVITDGESVPIAGAKIAAAFRRPPGVDTIFLHVWSGDERVFDGGQPEPQYSPDPRSRGILDAAADTLGGRVFAEDELDGAIAAARNALGDGTTVVQGQKRNRIALAPYLAGAVFLPLALLLWRRDR
ncbi:MAG TPA: VWA domain-containing protein [Gaiellaceae bacterium]|nr:VWA domain-containing protein [Gaiellaceae bacterium]